MTMKESRDTKTAPIISGYDLAKPVGERCL